ncbi:MAG: hypothetical protein ACOYVK_11780 [Bacillota bacterium]
MSHMLSIHPMDMYAIKQYKDYLLYQRKRSESPTPYHSQHRDILRNTKPFTSSSIYADSLSFLDAMRHSRDIDHVKIYYRELLQNNPKEAIRLINDEKLQFSSLFLLEPLIMEFSIADQLSLKNKMAIDFMHEANSPNKSVLSNGCSLCDYIQTASSTLKWIFETGINDDGLNNQYDKILDMTAILLSKVYKDKTALAPIIDTIFQRHKKGHYIHDLVWAFLECRDPFSFIVIGSHLLSDDQKDIKLACRLLHFVPGIDFNSTTDRHHQYLQLLNWIEENGLFLQYTGDSFQQSPHPIPYIVIHSAKYLCKIVCVDTGATLAPCSEEDSILINEFEKLDNDMQQRLSSFSYLMHQKDIHWWNNWIQYPLHEQIKIAQMRMEGGI